MEHVAAVATTMDQTGVVSLFGEVRVRSRPGFSIQSSVDGKGGGRPLCPKNSLNYLGIAAVLSQGLISDFIFKKQTNPPSLCV